MEDISPQHPSTTDTGHVAVLAQAVLASLLCRVSQVVCSAVHHEMLMYKFCDHVKTCQGCRGLAIQKRVGILYACFSPFDT